MPAAAALPNNLPNNLSGILSMPLSLAEFVANAKATGTVWSLKDNDDAWAMHEDPENFTEAMPVWVDEASAKAAAVGDWKSFAPVAISLANFIEDFLTALDDEAAWVAINFGSDDAGDLVDPLELSEALAA